MSVDIVAGVLLLGGAMLTTVVAGWYRRKGRRGDRTTPAPAAGLAHAGLPRLRPGPRLQVVAAAVLLAGAVTISAVSVAQPVASGSTLLWLVPASQGGPPRVIHLGITNDEHTRLSYRLDILLDGASLEQWSALALAPGQTWQVTLILPPGTEGISRTVSADLYRLDAPRTVYQRAQLRVHG